MGFFFSYVIFCFLFTDYQEMKFQTFNVTTIHYQSLVLHIIYSAPPFSLP